MGQVRPARDHDKRSTFFENGAAALERPNGPPEPAQRRIAHLEARVRTKDTVLAELMEEHVALKKSLGEA